MNFKGALAGLLTWPVSAALSAGLAAMPVSGLAQQTLSEADCVKAALERHPLMAVARDRRAEAAARVLQSRSQTLPQVGLSSSYLIYDWLPPNKEKILGGGNTDIYSEVSLSRLITSFGRVEGAVQAARYRLQIEEAALRRTSQTVVHNVRALYYAVGYAAMAVQYYSEAEQQMLQHLEVARGLEKAGKAAPLDVMRAEVQLADIRQSLLKARNNDKRSRMALNEAMGRGVAEPVAIVELSPDRPLPPDVPLKDIMERHPDAQAARLNVMRARSELSAARASSSPTVSLRGSLNYEGGRDPLDISNWNAGVALAVPIWDSGARKGLVGQASAALRQAESLLHLTEQRIDLEYRSARLALVEAHQRLKVTEKAAGLAAETLSVVQEKYRVGMGSSIEVLDAQTALTQARANRAQAVSDYLSALARWSLAIGEDPLEMPR